GSRRRHTRPFESAGRPVHLSDGGALAQMQNRSAPAMASLAFNSTSIENSLPLQASRTRPRSSPPSPRELANGLEIVSFAQSPPNAFPGPDESYDGDRQTVGSVAYVHGPAFRRGTVGRRGHSKPRDLHLSNGRHGGQRIQLLLRRDRPGCLEQPGAQL